MRLAPKASAAANAGEVIDLDSESHELPLAKSRQVVVAQSAEGNGNDDSVCLDVPWPSVDDEAELDALVVSIGGRDDLVSELDLAGQLLNHDALGSAVNAIALVRIVEQAETAAPWIFGSEEVDKVEV